MTETQPHRPTIAQVALGLFVTWQLLFLIFGNYLFVVGLRIGAAEENNEQPTWFPAAAKIVRSCQAIPQGWEELTGQIQYWRLFTPVVTEGDFPVVQIGSQEQLPSIFEPEEPLHYFRPPGGSDRLYTYQANMVLVFAGSEENPRVPEDEHKEWLAVLKEERVKRLRKNWKALMSYADWRIRRAHPDGVPSAEITILVRSYFTLDPGKESRWHGPVEQPLARWRPGAASAPGYLPIEVYDYETKEFVPLKEHE